MSTFSFEEMNLMCIYNTGSRIGVINSLEEMRPHLEEDENELRDGQYTQKALFYE